MSRLHEDKGMEFLIKWRLNGSAALASSLGQESFYMVSY